MKKKEEILVDKRIKRHFDNMELGMELRNRGYHVTEIGMPWNIEYLVVSCKRPEDTSDYEKLDYQT